MAAVHAHFGAGISSLCDKFALRAMTANPAGVLCESVELRALETHTLF
jgi:hypothetical protein